MKGITLAGLLVVAGALAGCAGGGGLGAPGSALPNPVKGGSASVPFSIEIPQAPTTALAKRPAFISSGTKSATITIASNGGAPGAPINVNCTTTCSTVLTVPIGPATFAVTLYDQVNQQGNVLAKGTKTATIVQNQANPIVVTFNPVLNHATISLSSSFNGASGFVSVPAGQPFVATLSIDAFDNSGAEIIGPGAYLDASYNPVTITIANSDTSGRTALSTSTFAGGDSAARPSNTATITYNGVAPHGVWPVFSASAPGYPTTAFSAPVTLEIQPTLVAQYTVPNAHGYAVGDLPVVGSDGHIWFYIYAPSGGDIIGALDPTTSAITEYPLGNTTAHLSSTGMVLGADGNLWFTERTSGAFGSVAKLSPTGTLTRYPLVSGTSDLPGVNLVRGADGNMYFDETIYTPSTNTNQRFVTRVTSAGVMTRNPFSTTFPTVDGMVAAYSGPNVYITEVVSGLVRLATLDTSTGAVTEAVYQSSLQRMSSLVATPDGNFYYGDPSSYEAKFDVMAGSQTYSPCLVGQHVILGPDGLLYGASTTNLLGRLAPLTGVCQDMGFYLNGFSIEVAIPDSPYVFAPDGSIYSYGGSLLGRIVY